MYRFGDYLRKRLLKESPDIFDPKQKPFYDRRMDQSIEDDDYNAHFNPDNMAVEPNFYSQFGKTGHPPYSQIGHTQGRLQPGEQNGQLPAGFQPHSPEGITSSPDYDSMTAGEIYHEIQAKMYTGGDLTPEEKSMLDVFRSASIKHGRKWKQMTVDELMQLGV